MREKKEINIQIGEQIKLAREGAKLTQEQLAERVGVSPQYVSDLERGVVGVSIATLKRICITLGVTSDQILFGTHPESSFSSILVKCRSLSQIQLTLLGDIVDRYVTAIETERK
ncbi:MAG: helix-turn-helix transcriptional regulator [Oscillospiraceae bacterium]|nr:helix-turn-helix transcriptional regulator [Oscillospiraceae bacterium]